MSVSVELYTSIVSDIYMMDVSAMLYTPYSISSSRALAACYITTVSWSDKSVRVGAAAGRWSRPAAAHRWRPQAVDANCSVAWEGCCLGGGGRDTEGAEPPRSPRCGRRGGVGRAPAWGVGAAR